jgi:hypothetical protein
VSATKGLWLSAFLAVLSAAAHAQPFPAADNILALGGASATSATSDESGADDLAFSTPSAVVAPASAAGAAPTVTPAVKVAMGTICPVYDAPPGEDDLRCDLTLGLSIRPASWRRLPHVHPFIGFGTKSLTLGVAYAMSERYAVGVGAMALREDYVDVSRVVPAVAFTVSLSGGGE